jgi:hypothetical protein
MGTTLSKTQLLAELNQENADWQALLDDIGFTNMMGSYALLMIPAIDVRSHPISSRSTSEHLLIIISSGTTKSSKVRMTQSLTVLYNFSKELFVSSPTDKENLHYVRYYT